MTETLRLPPHIVAQLDRLRASNRVAPEKISETEAALRIDMSLPVDERCWRWQAALGQLDRLLRTFR